MAIDHCSATDARVPADLPVIHNPHIVEYLRVAVSQSMVAHLPVAEHFCVVEDKSLLEDPPVVEDFRVAKNLPLVADSRVAVDARTGANPRAVRHHRLIEDLCVIENPALATLAQVVFRPDKAPHIARLHIAEILERPNAVERRAAHDDLLVRDQFVFPFPSGQLASDRHLTHRSYVQYARQK